MPKLLECFIAFLKTALIYFLNFKENLMSKWHAHSKACALKNDYYQKSFSWLFSLLAILFDEDLSQDNKAKSACAHINY